MKLSYLNLCLLLLTFSACENRPKHLVVRPLEQKKTQVEYATVFPFDLHPCVYFGKKMRSASSAAVLPDTLFTHRLRLNLKGRIDLDAAYTFPAVPLDAVFPDSVKLGDGFYYLLVLKAREGALFSRMHLERFPENLYKVRVYQQEVKGLSSPKSQYEETLRSFYPDQRGALKFEFYYYDSLLLERELEVF